MTDGRGPAPVALVTGGLGGIGSAISKILGEKGYSVVIADIAPSLPPMLDGFLELDLREEGQCREVVEAVRRKYGRLDLLVNNAGINARGNAETMPAAIWENIVDVNLNGTFRMCQAAYELLAASRGSVVNLGSTGGAVAIPGAAIYNVTKAAIMHLTKVLAVEWASAGIRVNVVAPTIVPSAMTRDVLSNSTYMTAKLSTIPLGRMVEPAEVAQAVAWLASPESAMVTGQTLFVDGGVNLL